jgi:hypothetical protein
MPHTWDRTPDDVSGKPSDIENVWKAIKAEQPWQTRKWDICDGVRKAMSSDPYFFDKSGEPIETAGDRLLNDTFVKLVVRFCLWAHINGFRDQTQGENFIDYEYYGAPKVGETMAPIEARWNATEEIPPERAPGQGPSGGQGSGRGRRS